MAGAETVLTASGLVGVRGGREVVSRVDLDLRRGEVVALMGPNGAGKSSLVRLLAGLDRPAGGTITSNSRPAAVLQEATLLDRTVLANVEAALSWWGVAAPERRRRALDALQRLGISQLRNVRARDLSGGEARRVNIARGLSLGAEILILDEPFAGLDADMRGRLLGETSTAIRDPRRATLVVVHDRAEAWALADRLVILADGRTVADGPLREVMESPPDIGTAAFLGFDGRIRTPAGSWLAVRPADVSLDEVGELEGTVSLVIPDEDGAVCEVDVPGGRLRVRCGLPAPAPGDSVRLTVRAGVEYPGDVG